MMRRIEQPQFAPVSGSAARIGIDEVSLVQASVEHVDVLNTQITFDSGNVFLAGARALVDIQDKLRDWSRTLATAAQHEAMTAKWRRTHEKTGVQPAVRPIGNRARQLASATGRIWPLVETPEAIHHSLRERLNQNVTVKGEGGQEMAAVYAPPNLLLDLIQASPARPRRLPSG